MMSILAGRTDYDSHTSKSGVALILVLGMLALMLVMAVAFAVYMRTERVAAGNFRNDVRARQLLHVALARALKDIDQNLGDGAVPSWNLRVSSSGSSNQSSYVTQITNFPAMDWLPCAPLAAGNNPMPQWITVTDVGERGRVAYMIVNCSGLVDINTSGGSDRGIGTNASEIQIARLPDVLNTNSLSSVRPYQTIQELNCYRGSSTCVATPVSNLVTYSLFPTQNCVYVGGPTNGWDSRAQIVQAFRDAGLGSDAAWGDFAENAYLSLLDYVDSDSIPQRLDAGCVEAVPMINEVDLEYQFTFNADRTWVADMVFHVEYAYPFVDHTSLAFDLNSTVNFAALDGNVDPNVVPATLNNLTAPLGVISEYGVIDVPAPQIRGGPVDPRTPMKVHFKCMLDLKILTGGVGCDAVPAGSTNYIPFEIDITPASNGMPVAVSKWIECIDPRFNWNPSDVAQWVPSDNIQAVIPNAQPTPNAINEITKYYLYPGNYGVTATEDYDGDLYMHVANAPLRTVGELGYLCYAQLRTIRLFAHPGAPDTESAPYHKVLDKFAVNRNRQVHGLINPNCKSTNVLGVAFVGMPTHDYGSDSANWEPLSWSAALNVASNIVAHGPYTNVSDLGRINWNSYVTGAHAELVGESYLRNTAGLLSCRQNLFEILLFAQATRHVPNLADDSVVAGTHALAEVWRDPLKNQDGKHPLFVRLFKLLNSDQP